MYEDMSFIIKMSFLVLGTILIVLGAIGIYGVIEIYEEFPDNNFIIAQIIVTISLLMIGFLKIDKSGKYTLYCGSNDGSKLYLDNTLIPKPRCSCHDE